MLHSGFLANGADSVSISTVEFQARLVAKMASPDIVAQEGGYMNRINRLLEDSGRPRLFPEVVAIRVDQWPAYYLMEAANPRSLDHVVYEDAAMTVLRPDRLPLIQRALDKLSHLHEVTHRAEEAAVARYHYLGRFEAIRERRDFRDAFESLFAGAASVDDMLARPVVIDGTFVARSFDTQIDLLRSNQGLLTQPTGGYLHGDVHLKNMLVSEDGSDVIYVDPRIVWDGHDVGDPGFGDPLYDFGTLLHSLHVMSPILRAIGDGETDALLQVEDVAIAGTAGLGVTAGLQRITSSDTIDWFTTALAGSVPREVLGDHWLARLHVNTANALFGWTKYAKAIRTRAAWLAVFAATLYHLEHAARYIERARDGVVR